MYRRIMLFSHIFPLSKTSRSAFEAVVKRVSGDESLQHHQHHHH